MDKEFIFYIIFGLIYLLSRFLRKKKKTAAPPPQPQQPQSSPQRQPVSTQPQSSSPQQEEKQEAPLSFEDILRELSGEGRKKSQQPVEPEPEPEPEPVRIPPPVKKPLVSQPAAQAPEDTNRSMGERNTDAANLWGAYKTENKDEDRNTEAADLWGAYKTGRKKEPILTTAEQLEKEQNPSTKFDEYNVVAKENPLTVEIREMLEDPEDVKKAIVIAEILQRKY